jgi:fatty-acyl-CoA synthase
MSMQTYLDVIDALAQVPPEAERGVTFLETPTGDRFVPYHQLAADARLLGRKLLARGLKAGDRVGVIVPHPEDFVPTFIGIVSAGLVPVPLYPPLALGRLDAYLDGTARILRAAAADVLVTTDKLATLLWATAAKIPTLSDVITVEALAKEPAPAPTDVVRPRPGDPVFLQFTSGSTAEPKGVVVTHQSLVAQCHALVSADCLDVDPVADTTVSWLPLYHDMGLIGFVLAPFYIRCNAVYIPTLSFVKRPSLWMEAHHRHKGTIAFAPNFAYARLAKRVTDAELERWDLSHVKILGCGAEPIQAATMRAFNERFAKAKLAPTAILPSYGMAEATLAMSMKNIREEMTIDRIDPALFTQKGEARPAIAGETLELVSCGRPIVGHEVGVFDEAGQRLPDRRIGELWFRGPSVTAGYFREPAATASVFREDGWLRTGDLGYLDGDQVYVTGRQKDIVIVNGRNYAPQAMEWVVEEVDGIRKGNVVAFSVPGRDTEEVVIAAETNEKDPARRAAIASQVRTHFAARMQITAADVVLLGVGDLPKTTSGKVQRKKTREQYLSRTLGQGSVRVAGNRGARLSIARHFVVGLANRLSNRAMRLWPRWPMTALVRRPSGRV